ncbi:BCCT family transporter [Agilicoccus flavus]|uniref:BCCT family transporter n=1 Tax=Agilicoccus flavus TaxID=2775968 RepID=UPI001CF6A326|nr:BCCT family transporter [Agilicoccus flavus]
MPGSDDAPPQTPTPPDRSGAAPQAPVAPSRHGQRTRRLLVEAAQAGTWPHGVHPALVPGVSVDDQRMRYDTDKVVLGVVTAVILAFVVWGVLATDSMSAASAAALEWVTTYFGWLFGVLAAVVLAYMLVLGFSRYGAIPLGLDGEKPEYSRFSWVAMLFAAGMGVGLLFFGPYEPMQYYLEPPPGTVDAQTREAMHRALVQTIFHWGPQAWAMYALVGAAVAYGAFRRGRSILMSSIFAPLLGKRIEGPAGKAIDIFAIIATLFGTAAALGIGALQIGRGIQIVAGLGEVGNTLLIGLVVVLTVAFIASAVSGVSRGIRYLSNINMVLALIVALFIFVVGPTLFLVDLIPSIVANYLRETLGMIAYSASYGEKEAAFLAAWTTFYWAWWVSWSPFVGIFIAKISRGRTLREFVVVTILVPSLVCLVSFCIYGGTSMWMQEQGRADIASAPNAQDSLFILLDALPLSTLTPIIIVFLLTVFFVTSADSASVVMGSLAQRGRSEPSSGVVITLGLFLSAIAVVMLLAGGQSALEGMQNLVTVSALPFAVAMLVMMFAFVADLRTDPMMIRREYARTALANAVREGTRAHGDDFALDVVSAPDGQGAGADFDSRDDKVTGWYQRRDEQGREIDYDYETGQYLDTGDADETHATPSGREVPARQGHRDENTADENTADR